MPTDLGASESLDNDQGDYLAIASKEEPKKSKNDETDEEKPPLKPEDDDDHPESALEKGKASSSDKKVSRNHTYRDVAWFDCVCLLTSRAPLFTMLLQMDAHFSPAAKDSNNQESFLAIFVELFLSMLGFSGQGNGGRLVREAPAEVSPDSFTVLLTDIPENSQDKIDEKMKELFPKSFVGAYAVHDSSQIASILAGRKHAFVRKKKSHCHRKFASLFSFVCVCITLLTQSWMVCAAAWTILNSSCTWITSLATANDRL